MILSSIILTLWSYAPYRVMARAEDMSPSQPNFVFFYADDLGYGDLACYGSQVAKNTLTLMLR